MQPQSENDEQRGLRGPQCGCERFLVMHTDAATDAETSQVEPMDP